MLYAAQFLKDNIVTLYQYQVSGGLIFQYSYLKGSCYAIVHVSNYD